MKITVLPVGELGTNCYILADEASKLCAVIDPGDEAERILAQVRAQGLQMKYILLTHGHYDHTTAVPTIRSELHIPTYINKKDANTDGKINLTDASLMLKYIAGWDGIELNVSLCDLSGNGRIDLMDVSIILKIIAGWKV